MRNFFVTIYLLLFVLNFGISQNLTKPHIVGPHGIQVNSYTGGLHYERKDLMIPGRGLSLDFTFTYNSARRNKDYGYGRGWTFSYNMRYYFDSTNVVIERMDGRRDKFLFNNGAFMCPNGVFDTLIQTQPGRFNLVTKNKTTYFFENGVHKKLTKIEDRCANTIQLSYSDTLLTKVTDPSGRFVVLSWTGGRLTSIADANKGTVRTMQYSYDQNGNQVRYTDALGNFEEYKYDDNKRLIALIDKNGYPINIEYNDVSAVRTLVSCIGSQKITYKPDIKRTFVVEQFENNSQVTTYTYDEGGRVMEEIGSCCGFNTKYQYDGDNNIVKRTDGNGNSTTAQFDKMGNKINEADALSGATQFTYETNFNFVQSIKDKNGNLTTHEFDPKGNLTKVSKQLGIIEQYTYDNFGNKLSFKDGNNKTTTYWHVRRMTGES